MKKIAIGVISFYKIVLSPLLVSFLGVSSICRYKISCSDYMMQMIEQKGVISGILLGMKRILSCSPFHK